ncbi:MAG: hypothetical protein KBT36_12915 [Kurthia sp.]|nr:hypothetical protein [Candidatus Kurthia equi]
MRKSFTSSTGNTVVYGIDRTTGLFLQFENLNQLINFSESHPFNERLTFANITGFVENGAIAKVEYEEALNQELGSFKVYFRGIGVLEDVSEDFQYPPRLEKHYFSGNGFKVRTVGDYMKLLKLFKHPVTYTTVQWYEVHPRKSIQHYEILNDQAI